MNFFFFNSIKLKQNPLLFILKKRKKQKKKNPILDSLEVQKWQTSENCGEVVVIGSIVVGVGVGVGAEEVKLEVRGGDVVGEEFVAAGFQGGKHQLHVAVKDAVDWFHAAGE